MRVSLVTKVLLCPVPFGPVRPPDVVYCARLPGTFGPRAQQVKKSFSSLSRALTAFLGRFFSRFFLLILSCISPLLNVFRIAGVGLSSLTYTLFPLRFFKSKKYKKALLTPNGRDWRPGRSSGRRPETWRLWASRTSGAATTTMMTSIIDADSRHSIFTVFLFKCPLVAQQLSSPVSFLFRALQFEQAMSTNSKALIQKLFAPFDSSARQVHDMARRCGGSTKVGGQLARPSPSGAVLHPE